MKIIKSLTIALVLLLTMVSFAAAEQPPEPPLIVKGEVEINDEPAPAGTQITAKLDGELIARSTVEKPGEYELHLLKMDDYTGITFTVDGTESQSSSEIAEKLNTANPTKATYLDLSVIESTGTGTTEVSMGSGGFASPSSGSGTTNQNDDNTANTGGTDSETKGTTAGDSSPDASTGTNGETESTATGPEETSSNVVLMVVGAIIIIGIIAAAGYKLKK